MTEPDDTRRLRPDPDLLAAATSIDASSPVRAGVLFALTWLAANVAAVAGLIASGLVAGAGEASSIALALTVPVALVVAFGALAARVAAAEARVVSLSRAAQRRDDATDPARVNQVAADALRTALAEDRAKTAEAHEATARKLSASAEAQTRIEAQLDTLAALASAAQTASRVQAAEARRKDAAAVASLARPAQRGDAPARGQPPPAGAFTEAPAARLTPVAAVQAPVPAPVPDDAQQPLPLLGAEPGAAAKERDWSMISRALDFPRDADDADGFAALSEAVKDPLVSDLLQAAEDTLTLLAQHNVYMEDLTVRPASPEHWAAFINGARGPAVAAVGGVQEVEAIDTVRALNRHDAIFRDTAMHLMRRYDAMMRRALEAPSGAHRLPELADTRTGRAYMLAARAVGAFD
jgi:hypothetical protein